MGAVAIHDAARAFDGVAGAYERGRPDYPAAAVALVTDVAAIVPGSTVVDLAAGTGKLTRRLAPSGARLIAVEPVAGMRAVLAARLPDVEVVDGTAEDTGLPPAVADAVTVGQAFHWFRGADALAEIHRILRPRGRLVLVWNRRDLTQDLQAAVEAVVAPLRGDTPSMAGGAWRRCLEESDLFGPLAEAHVPMEQPLDADGLVDRMLSVSFVAASDAARRVEVARRLRAVADAHAGDLVLRYVADCYWCEAR